MKKEPVNDLCLLFLRLIAEKTPDATAVLFSLRDASEWMKHYSVSADSSIIYNLPEIEKSDSCRKSLP